MKTPSKLCEFNAVFTPFERANDFERSIRRHKGKGRPLKAATATAKKTRARYPNIDPKIVECYEARRSIGSTLIAVPNFDKFLDGEEEWINSKDGEHFSIEIDSAVHRNRAVMFTDNGVDDDDDDDNREIDPSIKLENHADNVTANDIGIIRDERLAATATTVYRETAVQTDLIIPLDLGVEFTAALRNFVTQWSASDSSSLKL